MSALVADNLKLLHALHQPVPTRDKRGAAYVRGVDWPAVQRRGQERHRRVLRGEVLIPGLDVAALQARVDPAKATLPRPHRGSFQAPIDLSAPLFERLRLEKVQVFVAQMAAQGYTLCPSYKITITAGPYPAWDLRDGGLRLDRREYHITAHFTYRNPKPLRIELPPWVYEPRRATS